MKDNDQRLDQRDIDVLGIAAAGIVRLLLSKHVYDKCTGGATFLTDYKVPNGTYGEILIDEIHPVQVGRNRNSFE